MLPQWHFLLGAIFALLLWPIFGLGSLIIFAASFLVDFDHYLLYVKLTKNYNLSKAYYFMKKLAKDKSGKKYLFVFHTLELWLLLIAASFYSRYIFLIFIGVILHMLFDFGLTDSKYHFGNREFSLIAFLNYRVQKAKYLKKQNI